LEIKNKGVTFASSDSNNAHTYESDKLNTLIFITMETNYTYDIYFNDEYDSNNKGMSESLEYCKEYIRENNGTDHSYFADYKGGIVSIVCNETGETIYEEEVR
jgi:hypothetical protein